MGKNEQLNLTIKSDADARARREGDVTAEIARFGGDVEATLAELGGIAQQMLKSPRQLSAAAEEPRSAPRATHGRPPRPPATCATSRRRSAEIASQRTGETAAEVARVGTATADTRDNAAAVRRWPTISVRSHAASAARSTASFRSCVRRRAQN